MALTLPSAVVAVGTNYMNNTKTTLYFEHKFHLYSLHWGIKEGVPESSVSIATGYGLDGPGIESRWGRDFPHLSRPALGPPSLLYNGYRVFPQGKERPGRHADPSPPSSAVVMKG